MRIFSAILLAATLASCAARMPDPRPTDPCAIMQEEGAVDGGIGGTGRGVECAQVTQ